jgi:hypothetical protein
VCARRTLDIPGLRFRSRISGVDQDPDDCGVRDKFAQQLQPFCPECVDEKRHPGDVATWTVEAGNEAQLYRVGTNREYDRRGRAGIFHRDCSWRRERNDHRRAIGHQLGGQCGQSVEAAIRRTVFDCEVAALDVAGALKALPNSVDQSIIDLSAAE